MMIMDDDDDDDGQECVTCMVPYSSDVVSSHVPKLFHYGHSVCGACASSLPITKNRIICPFCRKSTTVSDIGLSVNYSLVEMLGRWTKVREAAKQLTSTTVKKKVPDASCANVVCGNLTLS